ncbi:MAG: carbon-nitrogen hydrolase family protein [Candidatus Bathyarchaeota archaeon]|nr:MAG: carbon-nitrogen hydrolase family protein [Candidatus Bathyarchaeota archaeon]
MSKKINVASAQIECKVGDKRYNIELMKKNIRQAKEKGADLVVFPELSLTGYLTRDLTYGLAETIPGSSINLLERIVRGEKLHMVFGMLERSDKARGVIYNTAVLLGPKGFIGKYRKMQLPTHSVFEEKRYFRPGYQLPVFETDIGRLGLTICYDIFFPEIFRLLRLKGAQFIVCISASPAVRRKFFEVFTAARAMENTVFLAYTNLVGLEDGLQFWGGSRIIAPSGRIITRARYDEEDLVTGEVDYADLARIEAFVPMLRDLRPAFYDLLKTHAEAL